MPGQSAGGDCSRELLVFSAAVATSMFMKRE